jgi:hypothetical protein
MSRALQHRNFVRRGPDIQGFAAQLRCREGARESSTLPLIGAILEDGV